MFAHGLIAKALVLPMVASVLFSCCQAKTVFAAYQEGPSSVAPGFEEHTHEAKDASLEETHHCDEEGHHQSISIPVKDAQGGTDLLGVFVVADAFVSRAVDEFQFSTAKTLDPPRLIGGCRQAMLGVYRS